MSSPAPLLLKIDTDINIGKELLNCLVIDNKLSKKYQYQYDKD